MNRVEFDWMLGLTLFPGLPVMELKKVTYSGKKIVWVQTVAAFKLKKLK